MSVSNKHTDTCRSLSQAVMDEQSQCLLELHPKPTCISKHTKFTLTQQNGNILSGLVNSAHMGTFGKQYLWHKGLYAQCTETQLLKIPQREGYKKYGVASSNIPLTLSVSSVL